MIHSHFHRSKVCSLVLWNYRNCSLLGFTAMDGATFAEEYTVHACVQYVPNTHIPDLAKYSVWSIPRPWSRLALFWPMEDQKTSKVLVRSSTASESPSPSHLHRIRIWVAAYNTFRAFPEPTIRQACLFFHYSHNYTSVTFHVYNHVQRDECFRECVRLQSYLWFITLRQRRRRAVSSQERDVTASFSTHLTP